MMNTNRLIPIDRRSRGPAFARPAFTLTELIVVMAVVVMLIMLALPALSWMTGSRSVEGGTNVVAAVVARARMRALNYDQPRGVLFFRHRDNDRRAMAIVEKVRFVEYNDETDFNQGDYVLHEGVRYVATDDPDLDESPPGGAWSEVNPDGIADLAENVVRLVPGEEFNYLPVGVDAQVLDNGGGGANDRYLSTGVIMFNSRGQLISEYWSLAADDLIGKAMVGETLPEDVHRESGVGVVLYDRRAFKDLPADDMDPELHTDDTDDADEEAWLDQYATPMLINRFNGTLMRPQ